MTITLGIAGALALYVAYLLWRGEWSERLGVIAAVALGVLMPQVFAAVATLAGSLAAWSSAALPSVGG